ncbi:acyl-CoA thioesterase/bile acid-CoA:amino acid N-acyltransferase family protein [Stenotrophomonas sp.]|uniref:acyl-CoA thioesterase/bile acid-CoA:amino acid N-acyltransferase family protein n=1 Tax=Stenotrophomonas sp. TaxID=69392 RepID=UPI0028AAAC55|nr:acyl-CoA thioesterase/bile acid-CoA:amino acid N-acyltransferase family protein [Stenotrophomonas sp.]
MRVCVSLLMWALAAPLAAAELHVGALDDGVDRVPQIRVTGLGAAEPVELRLDMHDARGQRWQSRALLRADLEGVMDTAVAAAEQGTYRGVDASGLIWSMQPESGDGSPSPMPQRMQPGALTFAPVTMQLTAYRNGRVLGEHTLLRHLSAAAVTAREVRIGGVTARVYLPGPMDASRPLHPAVITLGGAEGGIDTASAYAAWLASNGYVAVAVAYYRVPGRPKDLIDVPIEPVLQAVDWLQRQRGVDAERIGVMGGSWGGIVAMAAAAHDPRIRAVVSWVGSPAPFRGISRDVPPADFRGVDRPALSYRGQSLGYLPFDEGADWSRPTLQQAQVLEQAMLPIERINGPVMLVAGGDDQLGDSARMAAVAQRWLRERRTLPQPDEVAYFADAGHLITPFLQPTTFRHQTGPYIPVGGTPEGYARADRESGSRVLGFLGRVLGAGGTAER